jgi:hypothetical protein
VRRTNQALTANPSPRYRSALHELNHSIGLAKAPSNAVQTCKRRLQRTRALLQVCTALLGALASPMPCFGSSSCVSAEALHA